MKIHDCLLYRRAKELETADYGPADNRDKRIFNHAVSYMKKGKQSKVFGSTYFTDPYTTAEELESVIYYASIVGDKNYHQRGKTEHYDRYMNITMRNQLCMYLKDRAGWEKHCICIGIDFSEHDTADTCCQVVPSSLKMSDFNFTGLSEQEERVIFYFAHGFTDKDLALLLDLSINTIKTFRRRGLEKMRQINNHQKLLDLSQPIIGG